MADPKSREKILLKGERGQLTPTYMRCCKGVKATFLMA